MAEPANKPDPRFALEAITRLKKELPGAVLGQDEFRGQAWAVIAPDRLVEVCTFLRDCPDFRCDYLRDITAVDNLASADEAHRFQVVYQLYSIDFRGLLRLKVDLPEEDPEVDSVAGIWAAADWLERETFDMYGVKFRGHPDLRRILMPESYRYFPQRKDFPLEGIHDVEGI